MPGLVGIIRKRMHQNDGVIFNQMCEVLRHKDSYNIDKLFEPKSGVACARIHHGIINPEEQPRAFYGDKIRIFLYGEVYNDMGNLDQLEYVSQMYERYDEGFASKLNGSFLIVIIDEHKNRVVITNDRTASVPMFYFQTKDGFYFAPEMKALLAVPGLKREVNETAVGNFLSFGYFLGNNTLIEDIRKFDNACVAIIKDMNVNFRKYWRYRFNEDVKDRGLEYYKKQLSKLLIKAVVERLKTDNQYGIFLSGGYDSRGILGVYLENFEYGGLETSSWGQKEDVPGSDCYITKRMCKELGLKHEFYKLDPEGYPNNLRGFIYLSEGLADRFPNYPEGLSVLRRIKERQGVEIGLRGDQSWGQETSLFDSFIGDNGLQTKYKRILKNGYYSKFGRLNIDLVKEILSKVRYRNLKNRTDHLHLTEYTKLLYNQLHYIKTIEFDHRLPWIDNEVQVFMATVPPKYRIDKRLFVKTVTEMFPEIYKEAATKHNLIDFKSELKRSKELQELVYRELIENKFFRYLSE